MAISHQIKEMLKGSSFIRTMFEEGRVLKEKYGEDSICDFTIGNPQLEPPKSFSTAIKTIVDKKIPRKHGYMPSLGYKDVRESVAIRVSSEQKTDLNYQNIVMTCGAGGGLNIILRAILNRGDRVIAPIPYFVEYKNYVSNYGAEIDFVTSKDNFDLDLDSISNAITEKTAAIIINSPNNPSGTVYSLETIIQLGKILEEKSEEIGRTIYLISDEPYRKIVFDGVEVPPIHPHYSNSFVVTSCSKDLSIPGERIGWVSVNPLAYDLNEIVDALAFCKRILGFVNAPALMQRVIKEIINDEADLSVYQKKKDRLCSALKDMGYDFIEPKGTFYIMPKAPGGDDIKFIDKLKSYNILAVPGRGFGLKGYFRIAFCVDDDVIERSLVGFKEAIRS
ncbi:MAG: pyridoxal phosphate-dependent aminotransferase [Spirochaetaceae bacterium]